uniref:Uncharacterized protein n=1 Tax=Tanacetum cinerariifolium TaxID=118510 RepID=A0A6L2P1L9_TANCI|nr:hypothetical protein [Tanacetum cinerariifolium]
MALIEELEVLIVELFVDLFVGLFVVVSVDENQSYGVERKDSFIKCDMTRNDNFIGVQVKASISAMIVRVPEKDGWCGCCEVGGGGGVVGSVGVVCGDGVDRGVGGIDCGVVYGFICGVVCGGVC